MESKHGTDLDQRWEQPVTVDIHFPTGWVKNRTTKRLQAFFSQPRVVNYGIAAVPRKAVAEVSNRKAIGDLVANHGWQSESTDGLKGGWQW